MPLPPNDYVTMLSILLAFLYLTVSTRAFEISVPYFVVLNEPASANWTRSERDQGDFVFVLRPLQSGESEQLLDVPNNLSSGTISLNFTHPGCYEVGIGKFNAEFIAIPISSPVLVLEVDGNLNIPCNIETHNPKPSASSPPPDTALSSTTSNSATPNPPHHLSSFSAFPTSDSSLSSSTAASSSSILISTDAHSLSSSVSPTSGYSTIPSSGTPTSSYSPTILANSQSTSSSPSSATGSVSVSSTATSSSPASTSIFTDSQSTSFSLSSTLGSVTVPNSSSATSSPLPSISISSLLNSNAIDSDGLVPTTSLADLSSTSQLFLQVPSISAIDITAASTSLAPSPTNDFTSGTPSSAPSSQVADSPSSTTVSSDPSQEVTRSELPSHSFSSESSPNEATGPTALTTVPSSASVLQPTSTSYPYDSMEETRLPRVLGGVFAAVSILLVILGLVLYRRHRRLETRTRDIEARENFNRRSGGLLTRPTMTRTQSPQSFSSAYISSPSSSIYSTDEIVRLLDPSGHATGPDAASATTHESHESNALTRRESLDIASEHSYHSLTSNPFLDPPEGPPPPELPRPDAVKRKSPVVQRPTRSGTQRSNGTTDSETSRKTSRPESYFFMFVDGVMQPLDSRSDRYRSLVLSSECSFLMPDQIVLQERADALREEIVLLRRKISLSSDKRENEELLATIRLREEDLKRFDREMESEGKQRQSDDFPHFSMDDIVMDYSRTSR
ncbi:hypothetical protein EDD85DRAFT_10807 [Armillaria nabsnona]|nr:hypothetical protein EDD85DRAFT_10807 [Armillaria nabsnona]